MANQTYADEFYDKALRAAISSTIISKKANVCPFAVRLAWHASGTFDQNDANVQTAGGSDGATMRFAPEISDAANAGLALMQDILAPVQKKFPAVSVADLWTVAGSQAIKLLGGPDVPVSYGRTDATDPASCPPNGRLPDASQGAQHLRDVFYRMGFDDTAIVALSGAHTLGSCHRLRSGFDGPWTTNPLKFDNEYFKNLIELEWKPREWDGPLQYTDTKSGKLMMLPTDLALIQDEKFLPIVQAYAKDEELFFKDFAEAFRYVCSVVFIHVTGSSD
jgi:catalase (peroxidase I)